MKYPTNETFQAQSPLLTTCPHAKDLHGSLQKDVPTRSFLFSQKTRTDTQTFENDSQNTAQMITTHPIMDRHAEHSY